MRAVIAPCTSSRLPGASPLPHNTVPYICYTTPYDTIPYLTISLEYLLYSANYIPCNHQCHAAPNHTMIYNTIPDYINQSICYHTIQHTPYIYVIATYNTTPYPGARRPEGSNQVSQHIRRHLLLLEKRETYAKSKKIPLFDISCW